MGAPIRGIVYGLGAVLVPVAWVWGYRLGAAAIVVMVAVGMSLELALHFRR